MNQNLTLLLCKDYSKDTILLETCLASKNIEYITICDSCSIDKDTKIKESGFYNLTRSPYIKKPSSWDKAFYEIYEENLISKYNYFFFVEDDVYSKNYILLADFLIISNNNYNHDLITKCIRPKSHYPTWKHWKEEYINQFKSPSQSFNPICRLSNKLISKIFQYQKDNSRFDFHEILFASLCKEHDLSYIEYINDPILQQYVGAVSYKPILLKEEITDNKIYHPVKANKNARKIKEIT